MRTHRYDLHSGVRTHRYDVPSRTRCLCYIQSLTLSLVGLGRETYIFFIFMQFSAKIIPNKGLFTHNEIQPDKKWIRHCLSGRYKFYFQVTCTIDSFNWSEEKATSHPDGFILSSDKVQKKNSLSL